MDKFPPLQAACLPAGARSGLLRKLGRSGLRAQRSCWRSPRIRQITQGPPSPRRVLSVKLHPSLHYTSPARTAYTAASTRLAAWNFSWMLRRCFFTVFSLRNTRSAISLFE